MKTRDFLALLRPRHWAKNVFVFAPVVFAGRLNFAGDMLKTALAFVAFCLLSSSAYAYNDIADREQDRLHPQKRCRPVASGKIPPLSAAFVSIITALNGLVICYLVAEPLLVIALTYVALNIAYSVKLKDIPLVDVVSIAAGFIIRTVAGGVAINVPVSKWLLSCTFLLCLFLGFGKRRAELEQLGYKSAVGLRTVFFAYRALLLDILLAVSGVASLVAYVLYAVNPDTIRRFHGPFFVWVSPLVAYGIYRTTLLVREGKAAGPVEAVWKDSRLTSTVLAWAVYAAVVATIA
ncbi:MAG: decaprenyl-phosphate phosphoribosyltransferase [Candidatus Brocadiia bacterium]